MIRISDQLRRQIDIVDSWLTPTIVDQCARTEAPKLRSFRANLVQIAEEMETTEGEMPPGSVAIALEQMADAFAAFGPRVTLERATIISFIAAFNELAAGAWALEVLVRRHAGILAAEDVPVLQIARLLARQGVTRGVTSGRGDAA